MPFFDILRLRARWSPLRMRKNGVIFLIFPRAFKKLQPKIESVFFLPTGGCRISCNCWVYKQYTGLLPRFQLFQSRAHKMVDCWSRIFLGKHAHLDQQSTISWVCFGRVGNEGGSRYIVCTLNNYNQRWLKKKDSAWFFFVLNLHRCGWVWGRYPRVSWQRNMYEHHRKLHLFVCGRLHWRWTPMSRSVARPGVSV